jgi:hypothetical protein
MVDHEQMTEIHARRQWTALVVTYRRILEAGGFEDHEITARVRDFHHRYHDQFLGPEVLG